MRAHPAQPSLFEQGRESVYPYAPAAGKTRTSKAAAEKAAKSQLSIEKRVLALLSSNRTLSCEEMADILKLKITSVRPRVTGLVAQGKLIDSGKTRLNSDGNDEIIWRLK